MTIATNVIVLNVESFIPAAETTSLLVLTNGSQTQVAENSNSVSFNKLLDKNCSSLISHALNLKSQQESFQIKEGICDIKKLQNEKLISHVPKPRKFMKEKKSTGSQLFICEIDDCGRKFTSVGYLKHHQDVHRGEKNLSCEFEGCNRRFSWPSHLKYHLMTHTGSRLFKCPVIGCNKNFYTSQRLQVHKRIHTGEKPFVCKIEGCNKSFTTAGNLKNHFRIHSGDRPFVCKIEGCSKKFAENSSLKKHLTVHTGEKPFKCKVCGKTFSQSGSRNVHIKRHHQDRNSEPRVHKKNEDNLNIEENNLSRLNLSPSEDKNESHLKKDITITSHNDSIEETSQTANVIVVAEPNELMLSGNEYHFMDSNIQEEIVFSFDSPICTEKNDVLLTTTAANLYIT